MCTLASQCYVVLEPAVCVYIVWQQQQQQAGQQAAECPISGGSCDNGACVDVTVSPHEDMTLEDPFFVVKE